MFKKIQPNLFLKKVTFNFQNLQEYVVEKWVRQIPPISRNFKLNFDGSMVKNRSVSRWVIRNSNGIIQMIANKHMDDALIIITKYMTFKDGVLVVKNNEFLNPENEND